MSKLAWFQGWKEALACWSAGVLGLWDTVHSITASTLRQSFSLSALGHDVQNRPQNCPQPVMGAVSTAGCLSTMIVEKRDKGSRKSLGTMNSFSAKRLLISVRWPSSSSGICTSFPWVNYHLHTTVALGIRHSSPSSPPAVILPHLPQFCSFPLHHLPSD